MMGRRPCAPLPSPPACSFLLGRWYALPLLPAPGGFDAMNDLRLVGYDTHDPRAAVIAFQRYYRASEDDALDATDAAILASLTR